MTNVHNQIESIEPYENIQSGPFNAAHFQSGGTGAVPQQDAIAGLVGHASFCEDGSIQFCQWVTGANHDALGNPILSRRRPLLAELREQALPYMAGPQAGGYGPDAMRAFGDYFNDRVHSFFGDRHPYDNELLDRSRDLLIAQAAGQRCRIVTIGGVLTLQVAGAAAPNAPWTSQPIGIRLIN